MAKRKKEQALMSASTLAPFIWTGFAWLVLAAGAAAFFSGARAAQAAGWAFGLWFLCMADLLALAKVVSSALKLMGDFSEKKAALAIQALYWGVIKFSLLGLFGLVLIKGRASVPGLGLVLGVGTLVVVPLFGGFWWSQRVLRDE